MSDTAKNKFTSDLENEFEKNKLTSSIESEFERTAKAKIKTNDRR